MHGEEMHYSKEMDKSLKFDKIHKFFFPYLSMQAWQLSNVLK